MASIDLGMPSSQEAAHTGTSKYPLIASAPQREQRARGRRGPCLAAGASGPAHRKRVKSCLEPAASRSPHPAWPWPFNFFIKGAIFQGDIQEAGFPAWAGQALTSRAMPVAWHRPAGQVWGARPCALVRSQAGLEVAWTSGSR